ncbi:peptide MFS transporter [Psychrobium sp. MM17-31]|uniref:peptide MFS transporter n=1 Tax=Psychrobium sp. MM17-31 TaxID=2917758 RepID=UPI001EF64336|nr:peptide MFS transporter [Psychrobium sp. MM17-31]MCG7531164.1 peptide MFS transporter [Psychrobium sp. MM17-31]
MNNPTSFGASTDVFGHPRGLPTLFFTEMWERMSYYGMRALLVLFMTTAMQDGGLGITAANAAAIYGLYTGAVYFMGLSGGWVADRLIGSQKAIWYGAIIIMCGHIVLAVPTDESFFVGLVLVVLGTGLLKPNISALVGLLYKAGDPRRDAGYSIYYMGINLGSVIGNLVCGYLAVSMGYHWAFGAAAVGMALGLLYFRTKLDSLEGHGSEASEPMTQSAEKKSWGVIAFIMAGIATVTVLGIAGVITFDPVTIAGYTAVIFTIIFFLYFGYIFFLGQLDETEKKGMLALFLICVASTLFWSGFEQAGSSMNLFAQDHTNRMIGSFEIPTAWFQGLNSVYIIVLSPFIAALWINLGKKVYNPTSGIKCAIGLLIMASGFLVMFSAATYAAQGMKVAPYWLVVTYFLHSVGELCLSPIALSAVSKLSPKRFAGQMMGVFVLTYSIGNIVAGLLATGYDPKNVSTLPGLYYDIATISLIAGAVILVLMIFVTQKWEKAVETATNDQSEQEAKAATAS